MRRSPFLVLLAVTACAGGGGGWPSLARRPIEGPPPAGRGTCAVAPSSCVPPAAGPAAAPVPAATAPQPPTAPVAIDDVPAKLAVIDRDLTDAATRLSAQRATAAAAAAAARGVAEGPAWSKAQLEITALDRIGNQIDDLRGRLDAVAGTLAAASAGGSDVAAPLATTGRLIARATTLQADYAAAAAALR